MFKKAVIDGLWKQNPGVIQLLGLCPTLAVTTTVVNGLSLGLATVIVMIVANASISPIRRFIPDEIRVPIFILVIAASVTIIDLAIHAYAEPLYKALGIFIPLIVTNCIVLARVESFASKNPILPSFYDGLFMGLGLCFVLILLGGMRELLGKGTLFSGNELSIHEPGPKNHANTCQDGQKNDRLFNVDELTQLICPISHFLKFFAIGIHRILIFTILLQQCIWENCS